MRAEEKEWGKERRAESGDTEVVNRAFRSFAKVVFLALVGFHQKGIRRTKSGGRTRSILSSPGRGRLSDLDPFAAAQEWIYCKRRNKLQFIYVCSFGKEVAIRVWSFLGRCGLCSNVDGCSHGRIGSGKETESIMTKLAGEYRKRHTVYGEQREGDSA